jgi:predicted RNase H-like nuclease (RuvC/YqgF family)
MLTKRVILLIACLGVGLPYSHAFGACTKTLQECLKEEAELLAAIRRDEAELNRLDRTLSNEERLLNEERRSGLKNRLNDERRLSEEIRLNEETTRVLERDIRGIDRLLSELDPPPPVSP